MMIKRKKTINLVALVKKVEIKLLITGDKAGRVIFETLFPKDVEKLGEMSNWVEVKLTITESS